MRDRWRAAVLTTTDIDGETRAMLVVLLDWMSDTGRVSVPRDRLADLFAVDRRRITERIKRARDAGLLDKVGGGYRGRTAIYDAVIPSRKVAGSQPPFGDRHLSPRTNGTDRTDRTRKVAVGTVPNARAYLT